VRTKGKEKPTNIGLNLGPKSTGWLSEIGISTLADLQRIGAAPAYVMLLTQLGKPVSKNLLYALEGALQGRHYSSFTASEKRRLRAEAELEL